MSAPVEVVSMRAIPGAGNLRALATVRTGCITTHGWRVIQQPGQRAWVSVPQEQDREGRWHNRLEVSNPKVLESIRSAVLAAWEATR